MNRYKIKVFIISLIVVFAVALIGSAFTSGRTSGEWYESIRPEITPPNYVFPIVWSILFFLIAVSLYLSWINAKNKREKSKIAIYFGINFVLNILWSFLYFYLQNPSLAFFEIILLEISIGLLIFKTYKIKPLAGYLLVPYFLWVGFASILNLLSAK